MESFLYLAEKLGELPVYNKLITFGNYYPAALWHFPQFAQVSWGMSAAELLEGMASPRGFEPPTSGLGNRCSITLSV